MAAGEKTYNTPLAKKLGIREDHVVLPVNEPDGFRALLTDLPAGVTFDPTAKRADIILLFAATAKQVTAKLPGLAKRLSPGGGLWVAWPKKSGGLATDVDFDIVQKTGLATGLVDNKIGSIDSTWTALRFVYRRVKSNSPS
jgi:hypothetical protein